MSSIKFDAVTIQRLMELPITSALYFQLRDRDFVVIDKEHFIDLVHLAGFKLLEEKF